MKNTLKSWFFNRLNERSTWLGLTGLLAALGVGLSPEQQDTITTVGVGLVGAILTLTKDKAI